MAKKDELQEEVGLDELEPEVPQTNEDWDVGLDDDDLAIDLSDSKAPPDGEYVLRVEKVEKKTGRPTEANPNGLRMGRFTFTIVDDAAGTGVGKGRKVFQNLALHGPTARLIGELLAAAGLVSEDEEAPRVKMSDLLNLEVSAYCAMGKDSKDGKYQGQFEVKRFIK